MAKQQTFADKSKGKKGDTRINVRVIKAFRTTEGPTKFVERFIKVNDLPEIDKLDISI